MDILKAEIERKRKLLESRSLIDPNKKFFKREELIQKSAEEYHEKQALKYGLKSQTIGGQRNQTDDRRGGAEGGDSSGGQSSEASGQSSGDQRILQRKEVIKRLRERNEPIVLFAETEAEAFVRLRKLELLEPEASDQGFRNDFQVRLMLSKPTRV